MNRVVTSLGAILAIGAAFLAQPARAELNVSVTISGDLDEIIEVLEQLKRMGIGGDNKGANNPDSLQVRIRSIHEKDGVPGSLLDTLPPEGEAAEEEAAAPKPVAGLESPAANPAKVEAGDSCVISVRTVDPAGLIDTITVGVPALDFLADLRDDGNDGDEVAGDGMWSGRLTLPEAAAPGPYAIVFSAYGAYGAPLKTTNESGEERPLTASTAVTVKAPEPLPEMPTPEGPLYNGYAPDNGAEDDAPDAAATDDAVETPPAPGA